MAGNYLIPSRHGTLLYFRRRVPDDLRPIIGKPYLTRSLGTGLRRQAIILARAYAAHTDDLFYRLRTMSDPKSLADLVSRAKHKLELDALKDDHRDALTEQKLAHLQELERQRQEHARELESLRVKARDVVLRTALRGAQRPIAKDDSSHPNKLPGDSAKTISKAWEAYKAEKIAAGAWKDGEDTARYDHWPHVRTLIEVIGDKPISAVTADDINNFQTYVLNDPRGGAPKNREKRLTRAGAVFRWAKNKRTWGLSDDFATLFAFPGKIEKNPYVAFDQTDLRALFESGTYKSHAFKTPSEYWLPLLGLHTGARLNELCQLTKTDIGEHDNIPTISILDEEENKRLKTTASRRIVPIHSKLIELGFLDYVATIRAGRIFPELPEDPARPGNFGAKASELFTAYRRKCGVGQTEKRSNKAFHSFRSTLISALRKAGVPKDRRTRLAGHEYDDTQDSHYHGGDVLTMFDFATLKADIESVRFDIQLTPYRQQGHH